MAGGVIMAREVVVEAAVVGEMLALVIGVNAAQEDQAIMYPECLGGRCEAGARTVIGRRAVGRRCHPEADGTCPGRDQDQGECGDVENTFEHLVSLPGRFLQLRSPVRDRVTHERPETVAHP